MKNLRFTFVLTLMLMFIITSCSKENLGSIEAVNATFENAIDQSEMIPSSELYDNAEADIEKLMKDIQNSNNIDSKLGCPGIDASIQHWTPGSCIVQLATTSRREAGQKIRVMHYTIANGLEYDYTFNGLSGDDCTTKGFNFSISNTSLPVGGIYSYALIMKASGGWATYDFVYWNNCH